MTTACPQAGIEPAMGRVKDRRRLHMGCDKLGRNSESASAAIF